MKDYQKRVRTEKQVLDEKIEKLDGFLETPLAKSLPKMDAELMSRQRNVMFDYTTILGARIQRWL